MEAVWYDLGARQHMADVLTDLGRAIEQRRTELGFTKAQLQSRAGIGPSTYYRLISGDTGLISIRTLQNVANALGLSLTTLLSKDTDHARTNDYTVNKAEILAAVDEYIDVKLHEIQAPIVVPVYNSIDEMIDECAHGNIHSQTALDVPSSFVAGRKGLAALMVRGFPSNNYLFPEFSYVIIDCEPFTDLRNIRNKQNRLYAFAHGPEEDIIGYCIWDDKTEKVQCASLYKPETFVAYEYDSVRFPSEVVMIMYLNKDIDLRKWRKVRNETKSKGEKTKC